jgi:hypothetical protein
MIQFQAMEGIFSLRHPATEVKNTLLYLHSPVFMARCLVMHKDNSVHLYIFTIQTKNEYTQYVTEHNN